MRGAVSRVNEVRVSREIEWKLDVVRRGSEGKLGVGK